MNFKSESSTISFNEYLVLAIGLAAYFIIALWSWGFEFDRFLNEVNFFYLGLIGLVFIVSIVFLIYYMRNNNN